MEFEKYSLLDAFWRIASDQFGYSDPSPTLEKMVITLFVTHMSKSVLADMPSLRKNYMSFNALGGMNALSSYLPEVLVDSDTFEGVDSILIEWIRDRLLHEGNGAVKHVSLLDVNSILKKYTDEDIRYDASYRKFYREYDKLLDTSAFESVTITLDQDSLVHRDKLMKLDVRK